MKLCKPKRIANFEKSFVNKFIDRSNKELLKNVEAKEIMRILNKNIYGMIFIDIKFTINNNVKVWNI